MLGNVQSVWEVVSRPEASWVRAVALRCVGSSPGCFGVRTLCSAVLVLRSEVKCLEFEPQVALERWKCVGSGRCRVPQSGAMASSHRTDTAHGVETENVWLPRSKEIGAVTEPEGCQN